MRHPDEVAYDLERDEEYGWYTEKNGSGGRRWQIGPIPHVSWVEPNFADNVVLKPTPPELFINHGNDREMRWDAMYGRGYLVPNEMFYVRNHCATPVIDISAWRLAVDGDAVTKPFALSYDELLAMPSISLTRAMECAGNGRSFFEALVGKPIDGTQWRLGGIGVAEWTGVPLRAVLERAGVKKSARDVMPHGLDELKVNRPIPISKAMADDTLLAYAMNGQILPADHGFPLRMVIPGWAGIANIKWVGRIEVSRRPLFSAWNTEKYILYGGDYEPQPPAKGPMITTLNVKSAIELPWNASIPRAPTLLRGRSWSCFGKIDRVDVSLDRGETWQPARLREPNFPQAWVRWDIDWNPAPGKYAIRARAADDRGNVQPETIPLNEGGYLCGTMVDHSVTVTG